MRKIDLLISQIAGAGKQKYVASPSTSNGNPDRKDREKQELLAAGQILEMANLGEASSRPANREKTPEPSRKPDDQMTPGSGPDLVSRRTRSAQRSSTTTETGSTPEAMTIADESRLAPRMRLIAAADVDEPEGTTTMEKVIMEPGEEDSPDLTIISSRQPRPGHQDDL